MSGRKSRVGYTDRHGVVLHADDFIEGVREGVVAVPEVKENVTADCGVPFAKEPKRNKKNTAWHVHCPVCGAYLEKILDSSSGIVDCRRCHSPIGVVVDNGKVLVFELDDPDSESAVMRISKYQESLQRLNKGEIKEDYRIMAIYDTPVAT